MANRWKGNIIAASATTSDGTAYTGKANGAWGLNSQLQQKQASLWAKGIKAPTAPTIGTAAKLNASVAVTFTGSTDTGGGTITSYTATSTPSGITASSATSPITVTGLTNGTSYTFTVHANSSLGYTSPESSPSNSVTPTAQPSIGDPLGGGYYAGSISTTGNGVATHYLIVAPKASGETSAKEWGAMATLTSINSAINGPTNSAALAARGAAYQAAVFCEGLTIGGYSDWYLPAKNELEVLYYFLKPNTNNNDTSSGTNVNAVYPELISTNYTSGSPAQTSSTDFITGGSQALTSDYYWASSEINASYAWRQSFSNGEQPVFNYYYKSTPYYVRAVRRVPVPA